VSQQISTSAHLSVLSVSALAHQRPARRHIGTSAHQRYINYQHIESAHRISTSVHRHFIEKISEFGMISEANTTDLAD
jgi:hypothetical protein